MFRSADRALSLISALPMLLYQTGRRKRRRRRRRGGGERSRTERGEERGRKVQFSRTRSTFTFTPSASLRFLLLRRVRACVRDVCCERDGRGDHEHRTRLVYLDGPLQRQSTGTTLRLQQCNGNDPLLHDYSPICNNGKHCCPFDFVSNELL